MIATRNDIVPASWKATLDLSFVKKNNKTILAKKKHLGPLMVQKPFYPESHSCCHVYLIHPPGGIVGGDTLNLTAELNEHSHALITTPTATKFYRSNGNQASQSQNILLEKNAILEWLPQETIYYNDSYASSNTRISTSINNKFFAWEIQCLGLPAQKEFFDSGNCRQKLEIWHDSLPILIETNHLVGGDKLLSSNWGMQGFTSIGTFIVSENGNIISREAIKKLSQKYEGLSTAFTSINGVFVIRAMSACTEKIKEYFIHIWKTLRPQILNLEPCPPRIWST